MTKNGATCKKTVNANTKKYVSVWCNVNKHFETSCTKCSQVAVNAILLLEQLAMLLLNNCVSNNERDNFIRCRSIEKMNKKIEAETHESNERLQKMETQLTACVDAKMDNAIKTKCDKVDKSYGAVMAVQQIETGNTHTQATTKTMSDMDLNIQKTVRIQGVTEELEKSKVENLVPTTNVMNGKLERMGVTSHITELRRLGNFNSDRKKPKTLILTLSTEQEKNTCLSKGI